MKIDHRIETERLILRPLQLQDAGDYMEFRNSLFVLRYNGMEELSWEQIQSKLSNPREDELALVEKETGKVIGVVCVEEDSLRWGVASKELSYFLREDRARQGYMKEALRGVIRQLFCQENLVCVGARSFAPNTASRKLLESLGFHQDGTIRSCVEGYGGVVYDDTIYSLMRHEFEE